MGVVHRHAADHVGPLARSRAAGENKRGANKPTSTQIKAPFLKVCTQEVSSPGSRELPVVLIFRVAVDGDDADSRTGRVGDDDGLRLVTGKSRSVVDDGGGRMQRRHRSGRTKTLFHRLIANSVPGYQMKS